MESAVNRPFLCPSLIGRTAELALLRSMIEQTKAGHGQIALISGEAGIGKSRLVTEVQITAREQGLCHVKGACFPTDITCPYAPVLELVRGLLAIAPLDHLDGALAAMLHPLLPDLIPATAERLPLPSLEPEQAKRRLEGLLTQWVLRHAAQTPMLLIVEDLHWIDTNSLDFLHFFARHAVDCPLFILVTYRNDEMQPELFRWVAQLHRERLGQEIRLGPLNRAEADAMIATVFADRLLSNEQSRYLHGDLPAMLYTLTEGNPFFIEETLNALKVPEHIAADPDAGSRIADSAIAMPRSIQESVQRRTLHLSERAKQVLTLAAVAGRQFDFALLQLLTRFDEHELLGLMKELIAAHLVHEAADDIFAFRHALTRQAIYAQLLSRERRALHGTIARALEQQILESPHNHPREQHLEDLAYHFYQARAWEKTLDYGRRAGEKAVQLYAHRAAIEHFNRALAAAEHLTLPAAPELYRARGQAYEALGEFELAQHDYTQSLLLARANAQSGAEWQSMIDLGFLWAERDYAQAEPWLRQALSLAQTLADPRLHARSLNRLGNWYLNVEQPQQALQHHQAALTLFEQIQDAPGIAETLDLLGMVSFIGGDLISGTRYYQQAIAHFRALGDQPGLTSSLATLVLRSPTYQSDSLVATAHLATACQDAAAALLVAREIGQRGAEAYALFQLGLALASCGEYGRAVAQAQQSLLIAGEIEHRQWQTAAHTVLAGMYAAMLDYPAAREQSEQALLLAREIGSLFWTRIASGYLASIAILQQDYAAAHQVLLAVQGREIPAETMAQRMVWCAAIELELAQGQPTRALELVEWLTASDTAQTERQGSLRVLKMRGEILFALQRMDEAEAAFNAAQAIAVQCGARPMLWRIDIALGTLYLAQRRKPEADSAFRAAIELIEALATTIDEQAAHDQFINNATALFPIRPTPSRQQRTKQAFGGLTAREREVALLIAQGKSNMAIAEILIVTKRTVETHVGNIMFKLGYSSRTQIAVWASEIGLGTKTDHTDS